MSEPPDVSPESSAPVRHVLHLVHGFAAGGLENVVVQLIDSLPAHRFRHTVVALSRVDPDFARRVQRTDVSFVSMHKRPGQTFKLYPRLFGLLRRLRPDVVHTCNLAALECLPVVRAAGVSIRVHAEHGWDVADPDGSNRYFKWLRRLYAPLAQRVVAVSEPIERYLIEVVGLPREQVVLVENGVDTQRFRPRQKDDVLPSAFPFRTGEHWVVGTVGRLEAIKNQRLLIDAFVALVRRDPDTPWRLAIIGAGPLASVLERALADAGCAQLAWLPGVRHDIPEVLRRFDCFVLPSIAEGTSCTLQEAMASGLQIVATDVGGSAKVLGGGACGRLVPPSDVEALANAISGCRMHPRGYAAAARQRATEQYAKSSMIDRYEALFAAAVRNV